MHILLDECIDEALRHSFGAHDCQTCRYAGLTALANGELIAAAEQAGFEVLITVDQNMPYQQRLSGRAISLVVLQARTTNVEDLLALMAACAHRARRVETRRRCANCQSLTK